MWKYPDRPTCAVEWCKNNVQALSLVDDKYYCDEHAHSLGVYYDDHRVLSHFEED